MKEVYAIVSEIESDIIPKLITEFPDIVIKGQLEPINNSYHFIIKFKEETGKRIFDLTPDMDISQIERQLKLYISYCLYLEEFDEREAIIPPEIKDEDMVNHPSHYTSGAHECIDVMEAMFGTDAVICFCKCNIFKYRFRADKKNGEEDIKKAEWYETKLMELEKKFEESNAVNVIPARYY